jgi:hypothetical protein
MLDGEIAAFLPDGRMSFRSLQNHLGASPRPLGTSLPPLVMLFFRARSTKVEVRSSS